MSSKVKKGMFWTGMIAVMMVVINVFHHLFGALNVLASGPHGHGGPKGMGPHGSFSPLGGSASHHMIGYQQQGFSWLWFLLIASLVVAVIVVVMKWLRKKLKDAAMQQFIHTSIMNSHRPMPNQNTNVLDQWEKSLATKKEKI